MAGQTAKIARRSPTWYAIWRRRAGAEIHIGSVVELHGAGAAFAEGRLS
jgi:hypothetical protein